MEVKNCQHSFKIYHINDLPYLKAATLTHQSPYIHSDSPLELASWPSEAAVHFNSEREEKIYGYRKAGVHSFLQPVFIECLLCTRYGAGTEDIALNKADVLPDLMELRR